MHTSKQMSNITMRLNRKVYLLIYIFMLIFMFVNWSGYQSNAAVSSSIFNWILYAVNQSSTSMFIIPITFILTVSYLLSNSNNLLLIFRMQSRWSIFVYNLRIIVWNALLFMLFIITMVGLIAIQLKGINWNWSMSNRAILAQSLGVTGVYKVAPILQIMVSCLCMFLYLVWCGLLSQTINNLFKNKATAIFINIFIIIFQGKMTSIPALPEILSQYAPGNHLMLYAPSFNNKIDPHFMPVVLQNTFYLIICSLLMAMILRYIYQNKQFN